MTGWLRRQKFRVRLGTLVAAAVGLTVALAALAAYISVHHQLYSQVDSSLNEELAFLAPQGQFRVDRGGGLQRRYSNSYLQVIDPNGSVALVLPPNSPALPISRSDTGLATAGYGTHLRNISYRGQTYRLLTVGANQNTSNTAAIQIAQPLTDIEHSLRDLRLILWLVTLGGIAVGVGLGYVIGRATIRPVERLTAAAEHVAATQDLAQTIDDKGEDELARLARSFNAMLRALAASRQQQAQLISDAGHELRTPLTSLRTNIEVLLRVKDLPDQDRADLFTDVHAQLEEMTTLVGDVVELAREDEGQPEPIEVRFDSIVERAVERARRRAPLAVFDVELMRGSIRAQPAMLERAVLNVLDNAAKWSPPGSTVRVRLRRDQSWMLEVLDQGPGIAAGDLPHVFDRFYRAESARALPGSGLGLAIVQQVITSHGGSVAAASPPGGGALIHIELPTVAEHEPEPDPGPRTRPTWIPRGSHLPRRWPSHRPRQPPGRGWGPGHARSPAPGYPARRYSTPAPSQAPRPPPRRCPGPTPSWYPRPPRTCSSPILTAIRPRSLRTRWGAQTVPGTACASAPTPPHAQRRQPTADTPPNRLVVAPTGPSRSQNSPACVLPRSPADPGLGQEHESDRPVASPAGLRLGYDRATIPQPPGDARYDSCPERDSNPHALSDNGV